MIKFIKYYDRYADSDDYFYCLSNLKPPQEVLDSFLEYYTKHCVENEDVLNETRERMIELGFEEYVDKTDKVYIEFMT